jgi:hypothetical protein
VEPMKDLIEVAVIDIILFDVAMLVVLIVAGR